MSKVEVDVQTIKEAISAISGSIAINGKIANLDHALALLEAIKLPEANPYRPPDGAETFMCGRRMEGPTPFKGPDWWCAPRPGDNFRTCSYCGCMHPDELFALIGDGAEIGPTDKSYKIYVRHPTVRFGKFYFQHLSEEQRVLFIDLYNDKKMKIGMPGHFYVRPFFMTFQKPDEPA